MMRKFLLVMLLLGTTLFAGNIKVTFQVNMKVQMKKGVFGATDSVVARGDFQVDAGDVGNWQGNMFKLTDPNADSIYTLDVMLPDTKVGTTYNFKFVKNDSGWEPDPNRTFTLQNVVNQVLPAPYFANDSVFKVQVTNTINFTANMSDIYGTGVGVFDPNQDSILVAGLDWDNLGTVISGNRKLTEVLLPAKRFKTTMTIKGSLGDSTKWKFRAYPEARFNNTGWELGEDRWFKYVADGSTVTLTEIKPNISPVEPPTTSEVSLLLTCDMTQNPKNKYNQQVIPVNQIQFLGVKGGTALIGNWSGSWVATDTVGPNPTFVLMNDAGTDGDATAGDKKWSKKLVFPAGSNTGKIEYKYGAMYPGADTVNGGASYLDNEGAFGANHWFKLYQTTTTIVSNQIWGIMNGVIVDDKNTGKVVDFSLSQNYPNPFNPTTNFTYTIPEAAQVRLVVYNAMGEQVAVVFNGMQAAGTYHATIDGYGLSSGVYFYTLQAGNFTATRKMMLMK